MAESKVNWYQDRVILSVDKATDEMLTKLAFQIEGQAKVNIRDNGQIDTGFMVNSVYAVPPGGGSDYAEAQGAAEARNPKAVMLAETQAPEGGAAVAAGAEYAVYQEMANSFLYRALEQVAGDAEGKLREVRLR